MSTTVDKQATFHYSSKQAPGMFIERRAVGGVADVTLCGPGSQVERSVKRAELQAMLELVDAALADWPDE